MYPNPIKEKIAAGKPILGTSLFTREPHVAAAIFSATPDWVWIDQEHHPWGTESIGTICVQARQAGVAGVIRVPWNDPGDIKKAYDVGAVGVMIPQVNTAEAARNAVKYSHYPPVGERGIAPFFASLAGIDPNEIVLKANDETLLILQMESLEAWENVDEIIAVEDFDVMLVGPADLAASLGVPTQLHHPKVQSIMEELPRKLEGTGKIAGTTFAGFNDCIRWIDKGYLFMSIGSLLKYGVEVQRRHFETVRQTIG